MDPLTTGLLIALMVASFYFLIIRPNRKRQADQERLADSMQPGTRVLLNSGIYGTVADVGQKQVSVELAPGVQILVLKQAILQVITPESQFAEDAPVNDGTAAETEGPDARRFDDHRLADESVDGDRIADQRVTDDRIDVRSDDIDPRGHEGQKG